MPGVAGAVREVRERVGDGLHLARDVEVGDPCAQRRLDQRGGGLGEGPGAVDHGGRAVQCAVERGRIVGRRRPDVESGRSAARRRSLSGSRPDRTGVSPRSSSSDDDEASGVPVGAEHRYRRRSLDPDLHASLPRARRDHSGFHRAPRGPSAGSGRNATPRTLSDMSLVALAVTPGVPHFELAAGLRCVRRRPVAIWRPLVRVHRVRPGHRAGRRPLPARARRGTRPAGARRHRDRPGVRRPRRGPARRTGRRRTRGPRGGRPGGLPVHGRVRTGGSGPAGRRRATTHWLHAAALAAKYPRVEVDPDVLYVDDGSVLTSAGQGRRDGPVPAPGPPRPRLGRRQRGRAPPGRPAHRAAARPSSSPLRCPNPRPPPRRSCWPWAMERLDQPLTVEDLARRANMSSRHLARVFTPVTGTTPLRWLLTSASTAPRNSWRPPTTPSARSPRPRAWARRRRCAATSTARSASRRTPTDARSGREAAALAWFSTVSAAEARPPLGLG